MSTVKEIEDAVTHLSRDDLSQFRVWFENFDADEWDRQLEQDVLAGRLDHFIEASRKEIREGQHTALDWGA